MRLFLAINLPEGLRTPLFELGQGLRKFGDLKTVEGENIHLTLKFLGEAEPEKVVSSLNKIRFKPFEVSLKGMGVFPNEDYIRVVWVGCEKGAQEVIALHKEVELALPDFEKDRDFHPHATLARVRSPKDKEGLRKFIEENDREFGSFKAESFELMKSELSRGGPKYETVRSFRL
jgi:2'-5' RNA ligase